jgi:hypothetical protein
MDPRDLLYATRSGAGARAAQRFTELRRRWRQRVLRLPFRVAIALAVLLIIGEFIDRHMLSWGLGLALGAVETFWLSLSDSPTPHIENWRTGAHGEKRTARALAPLRRQGWILLHDLPDDEPDGRRRNLDRIAVGPSGVYLLDSKWLSGVSLVEGDMLRVQRKDDPDDSYILDRLAGSVRGKAVAVKRDIARSSVSWVQGVVVFWNDFDAGVLDARNPIYVSGERLACVSAPTSRPEPGPPDRASDRAEPAARKVARSLAVRRAPAQASA